MSGAPVPAVCVVVGDEELLVERAVARIAAAVREEDPTTEVHELAPGTFHPGQFAELTSPSLFGERRVVVLRAAQDIVKDMVPGVLAYAADPADTAVLVAVHAGGAKGKALLDGLLKAGAHRIDCAKLTKPAERLEFIRGEFQREGRSVTRNVAQTILDTVGSDLRELAAVCAQLCADTEGRIDEAAVARYYTGKAEVSGFTVADRALEGNLPDALEQLRWALAIGTSPVLITSALARSLRGLAIAGQPIRGVGEGEVAKRAGVPPWKIKSIRQQARHWTAHGIAHAIAVVAETDAQVKGAGTDPAYALERAITAIVAARR
ncbi:DNA polymerase III subunit delta [Allonocardiopsis opalescens]|uniref:DNA-directed DNA polymerase n=1 Tax=Allonocardiopsis opalescens TaxID=1144618 RepID=A0A2T0QFG5_9ACTN|nr:DNA polymerase III subunit delta [Allonocardiopsis opalescens]PRY02674.1 DNA polymerase III delta subunit [Allonocardiopsis opalescens]